MLFNVFINDIFLFIKNGSLYNYADDNTLSFCSPDIDLLISTLESESKILIEWFRVNKMQANPDKFQVLAVGKETYDKKNLLCIFKILILFVKKTVKLLGIEIDYQLNFDAHFQFDLQEGFTEIKCFKTFGLSFEQTK